jgi:hypothetical protein
MYAERIAYLAATSGPKHRLKKMPKTLEDYQAKLAREIEMLGPETLKESLRLFEDMDPWLRHNYGSFILTHYGRSGLPAVVHRFRSTEDPVLRGALLKCVRAMARIRHEYDRNTLALVGDAMQDHRGSWPIALPAGPRVKTRISALAHELALELVDDPHIPTPTVLGEETSRERRNAALEAAGKWLRQNLDALYVDADTGKYRLDKDAASRGAPTQRQGAWPLETLPEKLRWPQKLRDAEIPRPGG